MWHETELRTHWGAIEQANSAACLDGDSDLCGRGWRAGGSRCADHPPRMRLPSWMRVVVVLLGLLVMVLALIGIQVLKHQ
jgi:hypothetical protein